MTREEARQWLRDVVQRELTALRTDVALTMTAAKVIAAALDDAERVETRTIRLGDTLYVDVDLRAAIDAARGK